VTTTESTSPPTPVRSGDVAWTGDNPFIYLKKDPGGDWSSLSLFFRIAASKHGVGRAMVVVENPYDVSPTGDEARLVLTDNGPMARWLVDEFVAKFLLFRPSTVLGDLDYIDSAEFTQHLDGDTWVESAKSAEHSMSMTWRDLGAPFAVDQPAPQSGTGQHEMFAVFRIAGGGEVVVDGRRLDGSTVLRDFLNGPGQSAGMAISETWVEDPQ
jgi:hypothetical protein